jgi:hypothetical protein
MTASLCLMKLTLAAQVASRGFFSGARSPHGKSPKRLARPAGHFPNTVSGNEHAFIQRACPFFRHWWFIPASRQSPYRPNGYLPGACCNELDLRCSRPRELDVDEVADGDSW